MEDVNEGIESQIFSFRHIEKFIETSKEAMNLSENEAESQNREN